MIRGRKTLNIAYLLLVALFVSLCLSFFTPLNIPKAATHPSLSGGSGTANDPYLISTATDMTYLSNHVMNGGETSGKYYKLTNAINMLNKNFTPIGTLRSNGTTYYFEGNFDGNNCIIYNLSISNNGYASGDLGLFGYLKGTVKNVRLAGGTIKLTYTYKSAGGIVGSAYDSAKIENCSNTGVTVTCPEGSYGDQFIGGILGYTDSSNVTIKSCFNLQNISNLTYGIARVGGIAGKCVGTISECYNAGTITGGVDGKSTESYVGGIAGVDAKIDNCYNIGTVTANAIVNTESTNVASSFSQVIEDLRISISASTLKKEIEKAYSGGIVGYTNSSVTFSYNLGFIAGGKTRATVSTTFKPSGRVETGRGTWASWKDQYNEINISVSYDESLFFSEINGNYSSRSSDAFSPNDNYLSNLSYNVSEKLVDETTRFTGETSKVVTPIVLSTNTHSESSLSYSLNKDISVKDIDIKDTDVSGTKVNIKVDSSSVKINVKTSATFKSGKDGKETVPLSKDVVTTSFTRSKNYSYFNFYSNPKPIPASYSSSIWQQNDYINNGYPYLKSIYWSGGAQDFNS